MSANSTRCWSPPRLRLRLLPCSFDQDPPHRFGRRRKEMPLIVPLLRHGLIDQSQVRFVHERRRLQRLPGFLVRQLGGSQSAQFVIHERQQLFVAAGSPDSILAKMCVMSDMGINLTNPRPVFRRLVRCRGVRSLGPWVDRSAQAPVRVALSHRYIRGVWATSGLYLHAQAGRTAVSSLLSGPEEPECAPLAAHKVRRRRLGSFAPGSRQAAPAISRDGLMAVCDGSASRIHLFDLQTRQVKCEFTHPADLPAACAAFSPSGHTLTVWGLAIFNDNQTLVSGEWRPHRAVVGFAKQ